MRRILSAVVVVAVLAAPAFAQLTPDLKRGTRGVEAALGVAEGSYLRFLSPTRARVIGFQFSGRWVSAENTSVWPANSWFVSLRAGGRRYRSATSAIRPFMGAGLTGSYGSGSSSDSWGAGLYVQPGVAGWVTTNLSVNALVDLTAMYLHERFSASEVDVASVTVATPRLAATFYW